MKSAEARTRVLQAISEATPLALLFYSDTGRIVYANAGARELFFEGASPEGEEFPRAWSRKRPRSSSVRCSENPTSFSA